MVLQQRLDELIGARQPLMTKIDVEDMRGKRYFVVLKRYLRTIISSSLRWRLLREQRKTRCCAISLCRHTMNPILASFNANP
jgi:hypothetical protein